MSEMSSSHSSTDDAAWLAMQYALGELDGPERLRFEEVLSVDQHARDCLVEAVQILEACGEFALPVFPERIIVTTPRRDRRKWLALAGAVASLAVVIGVWSFMRSPEPREQVLTDDSSPSDAVEIVSRWADSSSESRGDDIESLLMEDDSISEDWQPPDWLLAAVAQEQFAVPSATPFDDESPRIERN